MGLHPADRAPSALSTVQMKAAGRTGARRRGNDVPFGGSPDDEEEKGKISDLLENGNIQMQLAKEGL